MHPWYAIYYIPYAKLTGMHTPGPDGEYAGGSGDHEYLFFGQWSWSNGAKKVSKSVPKMFLKSVQKRFKKVTQKLLNKISKKINKIILFGIWCLLTQTSIMFQLKYHLCFGFFCWCRILMDRITGKAPFDQNLTPPTIPLKLRRGTIGVNFARCYKYNAMGLTFFGGPYSNQMSQL